jgi:transcription initiation factor TFIIIB Brf1 subunit/transcription initiation factor TFIIB
MDECCGGYMIEDQHTGDSICSSCGRVFPDFQDQLKSDTHVQVQDSCLMEKCARGQIPPCIALYAQDCLTANGKEDEANRAYCLYQACEKMNAPRSIKEIASILDLSKRSRTKFSQKCNREIISPSTLAERVCKNLDIFDFKIISEISHLSDRVYETKLLSSPPQSVLAGCIALHCPFVSLQALAHECNISMSCLMRAIRTVRRACAQGKEKQSTHSKP